MRPEPLPRRPRLLVVLVLKAQRTSRITGGGEVSTIQIASGLRELGVRVTLVERNPSLVLGHGGALEEYRLSDSGGLLGDVLGVIRMVRATRPDSIYAFSDHRPETIVPSFVAALATRRRLFVAVLDDAYRAEDAQPFLGLIRGRVRRGLGFRSLLAYASFHASRRLACRMGACLESSRFMESYVRSVLHARRTYVVGRGVEEFWFERTGAGKDYDCVYWGRFNWWKRVSTLIRAWKIVVGRKPDARLLLIGGYGEELPLVSRLVDDFGLKANVTFRGWINDRRLLAGEVRSARLFVFPSIREGFPGSAREAMAAGLPCVLSDIAPMRDAFGDSAVFARPDDPTSFAEAILGLLFDEKRRLDYSERSRQLAKNFSWSEVANQVLGALSEQ